MYRKFIIFLALAFLSLLLAACPPVTFQAIGTAAPLPATSSTQSLIALSAIVTPTATIKTPIPLITQERVITTVTPISVTVTPLAQTSSAPAQNFPTLYILQSGIDNDNAVHILAGSEVKKYNVGDELVVYTTLATGVEIPIALVRVFEENPTTLSAQTILFNPNYPIQPNLILDNQVDKLNTSDLEPMPFIPAEGYLLQEGSIRIRRGVTFTVDTILQALTLKEEGKGGKIIDAVSSEPPIRMRVTNMGLLGKVASVELIEGKWPGAGTLVTVLPKSASMPISTPIPATDTPALALTATPAVTPTPKIVATSTRVKLGIKVEGAGAVRTISLLALPTVDQK